MASFHGDRVKITYTDLLSVHEYIIHYRWQGERNFSSVVMLSGFQSNIFSTRLEFRFRPMIRQRTNRF